MTLHEGILVGILVVPEIGVLPAYLLFTQEIPTLRAARLFGLLARLAYLGAAASALGIVVALVGGGDALYYQSVRLAADLWMAGMLLGVMTLVVLGRGDAVS